MEFMFMGTFYLRRLRDGEAFGKRSRPCGTNAALVSGEEHTLQPRGAQRFFYAAAVR